MIRSAGPADAVAVGACLASAFHRDPLWGGWAFPDSHAGRGIGMQLLRDCLARIDREGMPVHLESTNPLNVPRYEALGFVQAGAFDSPAGGPQIATMWRAGR